MKNLFGRLNVRIPEALQLKILLKNLLPSIQRQLTLIEIGSIEQLLQLGRKIEATRVTAEKYVPPPKRCEALEPDLAFVGPSGIEDSSAVPENNKSCIKECWNCGKTGHLSRDCRSPPKKRCYGCGKPGGTSVDRRPCQESRSKAVEVILDYIFTSVRNDERPYIEVDILGRRLVGLLDSGATNTILGSAGIAIVKSLNLVVNKCSFACTVANGEKCEVTGVVSIPITLLNKVTENVLGKAVAVEHKIVIKGTPVKQRYYPVSPAIQKVIDAELEEMLSMDVIERSDSPWASPILLVPKKEGGYRFCVDYRKVNQMTERDAYLLPRISWTLDRLRDAKYLTSLDIKSAYWQIPMEEGSKKYTAFTIPNRGLYQFKRMPFGLSNSTATWQRFIDSVLGTDLEPYVFVYLDDIVIVTSTFEKHLEVLTEVLRRINKAGLTLSRDKCKFCRESLKYLGYVVDKNGLQVDPEKVSAILEIPTPRKVKEVRRMLGVASWYRRFVPNFSTIIAPLSNLLRKNQKFIWSEACEKSWTQVKENLITAPVLSCPDFREEFSMQTDASDYGLGAVLSQVIEGEERVIAYLSRSLTLQERNFSTTEKECLAVLWAIEKLRPYVEGAHFKVVTDHYSLIWLNNLKNPSGRLARWTVRLQQYTFTIVHRKGKDHVVPDLLSRTVPVVVEELMINKKEIKRDPWYEKLKFLVKHQPQNFGNYRLEGQTLLKYVQGGKKGTDNNEHWNGRGYAYILVVLDLFSKFPLAFALRQATTSAIIKHLEENVFLIFGVPEVIISDNGVQFRAKEFEKILKSYSVRQQFTPFYHACANPTERVNRTIKTMLIGYVNDNHRKWDQYLPKILCALRTGRNEVTGSSPYFVNFKQEMVTRGEDHRNCWNTAVSNKEHQIKHTNQLYEEVHRRIKESGERSTNRYNLRQVPSNFQEGEKVYRRNFQLSDASKGFNAKLAEKFVGPFRIHKRITTDIFELENLEGERLLGHWHSNHLKRCRDST
nr:uncharacterized protein LOC111418530 [Onthophagus taurus]